MSTVITSCTLLSGRPAVAPVNSSGSRLQAGKVAAVALPCSQRKSRPLSVCFASPKGEHSAKTDLHPFNISPVALVHPVSQPEEQRWQLEEVADAVMLQFEVPGLSKEDLVVEIDEDVLVIKRTDLGTAGQDQRAAVRAAAKGKVEAAYNAGVYARLLVPAGYKKESVEAVLKSGVLKVKIFKVREHARRRINVDIAVE